MKDQMKLAGYEVVGLLGRGAGSTIWLARHLETGARRAVKYVPVRSEDDQRFAEQLANEFEVGSRLEHPCIRRVYEYKPIRRWFFRREGALIMEAADGITVQQQRPRMLTDILAIFLQVADGLEYMHRHGLIHADMKPGNIVVSKGGEVKVIDLGQSCRIGAVKQRLQGTPDHLAPEQAECRRLDERTDIYNFSSSLYWTLTGKVLRTAYSGVNTVSRTLHNETEDPTAALASECPAPLAELIRQSLKTDPEARPPSMAGVATRLQNVYARMRAMEVAQRRARHDPNETDLIGTRR